MKIAVIQSCSQVALTLLSSCSFSGKLWGWVYLTCRNEGLGRPDERVRGMVRGKGKIISEGGGFVEFPEGQKSPYRFPLRCCKNGERSGYHYREGRR
jgi:hypothetical protein